MDANRALGLPDDIRHYEAVRDILKSLGVQTIRLLTNNPRKVECLTELGVKVIGTVPCIVEPQSESMRNYMETKAREMRHTIPGDVTSAHRIFAHKNNANPAATTDSIAALN